MSLFSGIEKSIERGFQRWTETHCSARPIPTS